ncbi:hypothetical protein H0H93_015090 [Arthromyces matolae]|nr:hypothetical protein H0H93_015090 [Arthromyces matolae]
MVAANTPCTLHLSLLPPELACKLFYTMVSASRSWGRNRWWLFDRIVESPHRTSFFARKDSSAMREQAQHWYNGRKTDPPAMFPSVMEEACEFVERVVNEELRRRHRYPLEWNPAEKGESWRANVAASNCYEGSKESVGFHSDQLTYLGPYPTIASLSLGTERIFSLREVIPTEEANDRKARTFNVPLPHNSLAIMHASCQERFKHAIPPQQALDLYRPAFPETTGAEIEPSNCRINITFRFYRPDFAPSRTPRCKCNVPTVLRPDMKTRGDGRTDRYWWSCYAGAQNDETAPLLQDSQTQEANNVANQSFSERLETIAREPLTPLTKILLILTLVLLLSTSVFIGLFAGVQHKLTLERGRNNTPPITTTVIATHTTSFTTTRIATETSAPAPGPTTPPGETPAKTFMILQVRHRSLHLPAPTDIRVIAGGWLRDHPLPADKSSYGNFEAVQQHNIQVIQRILESNSEDITLERTPDQNILRKLRDFYASCVNEDHLDQLGDAPLLDFVQTLREKFHGKRESLDGKESFDLTSALAFIHSQGVEALFSFEVEGDVGRDPNDMVLWFNQPSLGLPSKEYYEDEAILDVYRGAVRRLLLTLSENIEDGDAERPVKSPLVLNQESNDWPPWPWPPWDGGEGDNDGDKNPTNRSEHARKLARKVVKFERSLAHASLDLDVLLQDPIATYNPLLLSNLTEALPQIDFPAYFAAHTPRNFPSIVVQTYPSYASSLAQILDKTPKEVIEAYLITRAALALAPHLGATTEAWQAQRVIYEVLNGIKKGIVGDRSEYCVEKVEESLGFAVGRYFVNETFGGDSKEKGTKVIKDIIKSFKASLTHIEWIDETSAKAAASKADSLRVKVGYPSSPDTEDASSINRYYSQVKVDKFNFFDNVLSAMKSDQFRRWQQLGKRRNLDAWDMFPSTVNAYFNPPANEIVFPAGILQPPFFDASWPSYISYGAFGHVASHELTHAFDSAGRLYNQDGKLEEWWTNYTSEGFQIKQKCIVDQYSRYTIDDGKGGKMHVNMSPRTSGENIGDTGLIQAYRAWKAQYDESSQAGHELLLPGLTYTSLPVGHRDQLFFISFARIWARAMKTAAAVQRIRTDPHSPTRFRVDGTVFNIPEFAEAFNCSKKAKNTLCTWNIISPCPFNGLSYCQGQGFESRLGPTKRDQKSNQIPDTDTLFYKFSESPHLALRARSKAIQQLAPCPVCASSHDHVHAHTKAQPRAVKYECPDCGWPTHCSPEHHAQDEEHHKYCSRLREANEDEHDLRSGRRLREFELPGPQGYEEAISFANWDVFWYTRGFPSMDSERSRRHASKLLTFPITIGNAIHQYSSLTLSNQRLTPEGSRSLAALRSTLHVAPGAPETAEAVVGKPQVRIFLLGARAESSLPPHVWEQLTMLFPSTHLHLFFIGPQVSLPKAESSRPASESTSTQTGDSASETSPIKSTSSHTTTNTQEKSAEVTEKKPDYLPNVYQPPTPAPIERLKRTRSSIERYGVPSYTVPYTPQLTITGLQANYADVHALFQNTLDPYSDLFFMFCPGFGFPSPESVSEETGEPVLQISSPTEWGPVMPMLLASKCPIFVTGFSPTDVERDVRSLSTAPDVAGEFEWVITPGPNAFGSEKWEIADFDPRVMVKANWGIWGIRGKSRDIQETGYSLW